jgi:lipopolysaccharide export system permease protein
MMNLSQLNNAVDSLKIKIEKRKIEFGKQLNQTYYSKSAQLAANTQEIKSKVAFADLSKAQKLNAIEIASNIARSAKAYTESVSSEYASDVFSVDKFNTEWHRKFTLSIACVVLFFIGAPLGAIIRKGGLGMPMVVSIIFFLIFHILSITGEKLAKEGEIPPYQGMWLATIILLPIGIFLTYKATSDSNLFNADAYITPIKNFFTRKK